MSRKQGNHDVTFHEYIIIAGLIRVWLNLNVIFGFKILYVLISGYITVFKNFDI